MLKRRYHVASQRIQDFFWKLFSCFSNFKCNAYRWARKRIHYSCEDGIEKSVPRNHRLSSLSKPHDDNWWSLGRIFLSHSNTHKGSLYSLPTKTFTMMSAVVKRQNLKTHKQTAIHKIEDLTWVLMFYLINWTSWGKEIKCEACRAFYLFFATSLINSIIQEHEC